MGAMLWGQIYPDTLELYAAALTKGKQVPAWAHAFNACVRYIRPATPERIGNDKVSIVDTWLYKSGHIGIYPEDIQTLSISGKQLANELGITEQAASQALKKCVEVGLLERIQKGDKGKGASLYAVMPLGKSLPSADESNKITKANHEQSALVMNEAETTEQEAFKPENDNSLLKQNNDITKANRDSLLKQNSEITKEDYSESAFTSKEVIPNTFNPNLFRVCGRAQARLPQPPTRKEVQDWFSENNYRLNADSFFEFFEEKQWKHRDGNTIRDWCSVAAAWERNIPSMKELEKYIEEKNYSFNAELFLDRYAATGFQELMYTDWKTIADAWQRKEEEYGSCTSKKEAKKKAMRKMKINSFLCLEKYNKVFGTTHESMKRENIEFLNTLPPLNAEEVEEMLRYKKSEWEGTRFNRFLTTGMLFSHDYFESYMQQAITDKTVPKRSL